MGVVHPGEPQGRDFAATDTHLFRVSPPRAAQGARLGHLRIVRQWAGVYDMTPDRKR
jgi:glycine/D-amino acid oxidase-like deaminating enzyme